MSNLLNFSIMKDDARLMRVHPGAVFYVDLLGCNIEKNNHLVYNSV